MFKKISRAILVALLIFNTTIVNISASKLNQFYALDLSTISEDVKPYLTSIVVEKADNKTYINNQYVGTITNTSSQTFTLHENNFTLTVAISLANLSVDAHAVIETSKIYTSSFVFQIAENKYYICTFYPDANSSSGSQTIQSIRNGDVHNFNTFHATYGSESKSYDVQLVQSTGEVYVNGQKLTTVVNKETVQIVFEYIGENFPIKEIDYQRQLDSVDWATASSNVPVYKNQNIDGISVKQEYDLTNEYLNLPRETRYYSTWLDEWVRVAGTSQSGTGVWKKTGNKIKVVCEWTEDNTCGNTMKNQFPRYWIVWGEKTSATYPLISSTEEKVVKAHTYENYYYPVDKWVVQETFNKTKSAISTTAYQMSSRTISWSNYTDEWTDMDPSSYAMSHGLSTEDIRYTTAKLWKRRTADWGAWSSWSTSAAPEYDDVETRTTYSSRTYTDTWASVCDSSDGYSLGTRQLYRYCTKSCSEWNYQYDNWSAYSTSKTGDYQDQCVSRTGINSECGTKTVTYDCSYSEDYDCSYNTTENYRCSVYVSKTCYYYGTTCSTCSRQEKYDCGYGKYGYSCKVRTVNYSCNCRSEVTGSYECGSNQDSTCSRTVHVSKTCSRIIPKDCSTVETQRCTSYSCPLSRTATSCKTYGDCTNWTDWTTAACQNTAYNTCESTTQYNCRVFSGWSDYSTSSCDTSNSMTCKTRTEYRWRYKSWGDWSTYQYLTCQNSTLTECQQATWDRYRYSTKVFGDWGQWYNTRTEGTDTKNYDYRYRYNDGVAEWEEEKGTATQGQPYSGWWSGEENENGTVKKLLTLAIIEKDKKTYSNESQMTKEQVEAWQKQYAEDAAGSTYYSNHFKENGYILWSDWQKDKLTSVAYTSALSEIKDKEIYQPYLYFYGWRFFTGNYDLPVGSATTSSTVFTTIHKYSHDGKLVESTEEFERESKVIYFNYKNPLQFQEEVPDNWKEYSEGYEALLDEIQNSDLSNYKIKIKLSGEKIKQMRDWLDNGGYSKLGTCEMLREFSDIFEVTDSELADWFNSGDSCEIKETEGH